jgi:4'-phosphopantetheinyl transferase
MALVYLRNLDEQTRFAIWKVEETAEDLTLRLQWLATRVLLRTMLDTTGYIDCPSDANGKPYLANFPDRISLTHSYEYAAVMLSKKGEVGIDLELVKPKITRIANKFLQDEELAFIGGPDPVRQLYACWCAKEAVYKLQGNKGVSFREHMRVLPFEYQDQGTLWLELNGPERQETFKVYYEQFQDYMLGYVIEG